MTLSVIVPTIGRRTLARMLSTIVPQLLEGDEVIVVGDGPREEARRTAALWGQKVSYHETAPTGEWGHAQRNFGMALAKGAHLAFMDDDDVWLHKARLSIQEALAVHPRSLLFFRMRHRGEVVWRTRTLAVDNVSTQMYVFPNEPARLAAWRRSPDREDGKGGDFLFARDTAALWPRDAQVFLEAVIAELVDHNNGLLEV